MGGIQEVPPGPGPRHRGRRRPRASSEGSGDSGPRTSVFTRDFKGDPRDTQWAGEVLLTLEPLTPVGPETPYVCRCVGHRSKRNLQPLSTPRQGPDHLVSEPHFRGCLLPQEPNSGRLKTFL